MARRRTWWGRRPFKRRSYEYNHALHAFEDELILRKIGTRQMTAADLDRENPDLFNLKYLMKALRRMYKQGTLERHRSIGRFVRGHGWAYKRRQQTKRKAA